MSPSRYQGAVALIVNGLKAIAMGLVAQLVMFGLEMAMELTDFPFPSSILAMLLVFLVLLAVGSVWDRFEHFYDNHLREPVSSLDIKGSVTKTLSRLMLTETSRRICLIDTCLSASQSR
jgi:hypothetical protein